MIFAKRSLYSFALSFRSKSRRLVYLSGPFLFEFPKFRGQVDVSRADVGLPAPPLGRQRKGWGKWCWWLVQMGSLLPDKGRGGAGRRLRLMSRSRAGGGIAHHFSESALV